MNPVEKNQIDQRITINHLRVLKAFSGQIDVQFGHVEIFLLRHVSQPTARKIIEDLISFKFIKSYKSKRDKRLKLLSFGSTNIEELI